MTDSQIDKERDKQTDIHRDRQTDRQRQREKQTDRQTETERAEQSKIRLDPHLSGLQLRVVKVPEVGVVLQSSDTVGLLHTGHSL